MYRSMKIKSAIWFECGVRFETVTEDGTTKKVREVHVVNGMTFGEAYDNIVEESSNISSGEVEVMSMKVAPYGSIVYDEDNRCERYYVVKLALITLDERTNKEKRTNFYMLVEADSVDSARKLTDKYMSTSMVSYETMAVKDTKIIAFYCR
ncbi:MAG: DUF4494 domain-containing protein [Muribaculaceae bacterium]